MTMMKHLSVAVLALLTAVITSCTEDPIIKYADNGIPDAESNIVTVTTTVSLDGGTRALDTNGKRTFAVGDDVAVVYKNIYGKNVKAVSGVLTADNITDGGKSATFTLVLINPDSTQNVTYIYPATMANSDGTVNYEALNAQDGTLATLSAKLDYCSGPGEWVDNNKLPKADLESNLAIGLFALKNSDGSSTITSEMKTVIICDDTNAYTVKPNGDTFGSDVIYVAMKPVTNGAPLNIIASDGTNFYCQNTISRAYPAGGFIELPMEMEDATRESIKTTVEEDTTDPVFEGDNIIVRGKFAEAGSGTYINWNPNGDNHNMMYISSKNGEKIQKVDIHFHGNSKFFAGLTHSTYGIVKCANLNENGYILNVNSRELTITSNSDLSSNDEKVTIDRVDVYYINAPQ